VGAASRRDKSEMKNSNFQIPEKGSRKLRIGRRSIPGQVYLLTTATCERRPVFKNRQAAEIVMNSVNYLETEGVIVVEVMVLMPDHLHLAASVSKGTLEELMQRFKSFTAKGINKMLNRKGPVWNPQYHDHAIRKDEVLLDVIRYCLNNPVRAGLVDNFHDYPYWYCRYDV
jgi:REP element-mobilizing transposase RayT